VSSGVLGARTHCMAAHCRDRSFTSSASTRTCPNAASTLGSNVASAVVVAISANLLGLIAALTEPGSRLITCSRSEASRSDAVGFGMQLYYIYFDE
jgi:hypothetical protein